MRRILILTAGHACHNPRAFKEADTLAEAGFDVEWLGAWFDPELAARDRLVTKDRGWRFTPVTDWTRETFMFRLTRQWQRLRRWLGGKLHKFFRFENRWQLSYCSSELLHAALKHGADLLIAHSEVALWVADKLRGGGRRVGVDMEDWFSEDLPIRARAERPVKMLRRLECSLLQKSLYRTCTSHVMSDALSDEYRCEPPTVIYNAFPLSDREKVDSSTKDRHDHGCPSIHWFSQTLGFDRGLDDLVSALSSLRYNAEIHLRGKPADGFVEWLDKAVAVEWRARVFIHELVSNEELLSRIREHDIGFAGEQEYCRNKDLTVSNKILHYLLAGLAVVASDTAGHREVAEQGSGGVLLYRSGDSADLAKQLNKLLGSAQDLTNAKRAAHAAAETTFCWEKQAPKLVAAVEAALLA